MSSLVFGDTGVYKGVEYIIGNDNRMLRQNNPGLDGKYTPHGPNTLRSTGLQLERGRGGRRERNQNCAFAVTAEIVWVISNNK